VVDKNSAKGIVVVIAHGFPIHQADTGQGRMDDSYAELIIQEGQACVTYGSPTVLFYKPRKVVFSNLDSQQPQLREAKQSRVLSINELINHGPSTQIPSAPKITLMLQIDKGGRYNRLDYDISVLGFKRKTTTFFAWFQSQTGRGGSKGPPALTFHFPNARPGTKSISVVRLIEDDLRYVRKMIFAHYEKAKLYDPGLKEFVVFVTDLKWSL